MSMLDSKGGEIADSSRNYVDVNVKSMAVLGFVADEHVIES